MAFNLLIPSDTASRGQYREAFQINFDSIALRGAIGVRWRRERKWKLGDVSCAAPSNRQFCDGLR